MGLRRIPDCGIANMRDLGGYPAANGMTRYGVFYRGGSPADMTQANVERLVDMGITTVVDLRNPLESDRNPFAGEKRLDVHRIPLLAFHEKLAPSMETTLDVLYVQALAHAKEEIARVLLALLNARGGALFHCTAGKDRTGVIAMLLLLLCGVDNLDVLADYQTSNTYLEHVIAKITQVAYEVPLAMLMSTPDLLKPAIDAVAQAGGIRAYLASCGLSQRQMDALANKMVQPLPGM